LVAFLIRFLPSFKHLCLGRLVQLQKFKKTLLVPINSELYSRSCDFLYKLLKRYLFDIAPVWKRDSFPYLGLKKYPFWWELLHIACYVKYFLTTELVTTGLSVHIFFCCRYLQETTIKPQLFLTTWKLFSWQGSFGLLWKPSIEVQPCVLKCIPTQSICNTTAIREVGSDGVYWQLISGHKTNLQRRIFVLKTDIFDYLQVSKFFADNWKTS